MIRCPCKQEGATVIGSGCSPEPTAAAPAGLIGRRYFWPLLLLAGYLLFAHGCHGDEDNELFTGFSLQLPANGAQRFYEASLTD
jgi:hypothetical protein